MHIIEGDFPQWLEEKAAMKIQELRENNENDPQASLILWASRNKPGQATIWSCSRSADILLGLHKSEKTGPPLVYRAFIHPDDRTIAREMLRYGRKTQKWIDATLRWRSKTGRFQYMNFTGQYIHKKIWRNWLYPIINLRNVDVANLIQLNPRDVTAEEVLRYAEKVVARSKTLYGLFDSLTPLLRDVTAAKNVTLLVTHPDNRDVVVGNITTLENGYEPLPTLMPSYKTSVSGMPSLHFLAQKKAPFIISDTRQQVGLFDWIPQSQKSDWHSVLGYPILHPKTEEPLGFVFLSSFKVDHFNQDDTDILGILEPAIAKSIVHMPRAEFEPTEEMQQIAGESV